MGARTHNQKQIMISLMRKRKVKNYEFTQMGILSYPKRISEIRNLGVRVEKERIWRRGKATGTFQYWIPQPKKKAKDWNKYEI